MKRYKKQQDDTTNSSVYKKCLNRDRLIVKCSVCPPNKGCNSKRKKNGAKKPKYKDKR